MDFSKKKHPLIEGKKLTKVEEKEMEKEIKNWELENKKRVEIFLKIKTQVKGKGKQKPYPLFLYTEDERLPKWHCHNGFPLQLGWPQKLNGVAIDLFCTGVIGHQGCMFLS